MAEITISNMYAKTQNEKSLEEMVSNNRTFFVNSFDENFSFSSFEKPRAMMMCIHVTVLLSFHYHLDCHTIKFGTPVTIIIVNGNTFYAHTKVQSTQIYHELPKLRI